MAAWLDALAALERAGRPSVLVTVLAARGSTPREAGCKMVVTRDALVRHDRRRQPRIRLHRRRARHAADGSGGR